MDRRAALKKLAAGGAIAAGGSFVLSSNQVAFAASDTNIPDSGVNLPIASSSTQGEVAISDPAFYTCTGEQVTTTYAWRINGYDLRPPGNTVIELVDAATGAVLYEGNGFPMCTSCGGSYMSGSSSASLRRDHSKLKNGDEYNIGLMVTWECGAVVTVHEYEVTGIYPGPSTATYVA